MSRALFIGLLLAGLSLPAAAAEPLSWDDALRLAGQNNSELAAARANLAAASYQADAAWSGFLPQLSAGLGYDYGDDFGSSAAAPGPASTYFADVTLRQNLFRGLESRSRVGQARANREAARANLDLVRAKVTSDLKSAFENLLYAQTYLSLAEQIVRRRERT